VNIVQNDIKTSITLGHHSREIAILNAECATEYCTFTDTAGTKERPPFLHGFILHGAQILRPKQFRFLFRIREVILSISKVIHSNSFLFYDFSLNRSL
jgi:hypothetical protein